MPIKHFLTISIALFISGLTLASNTLSLTSVSGAPNTEVEIGVMLSNSDAISALEITIPLSEDFTYVEASAKMNASRSNGHMISAAQVSNELRIYVYSLSLATFKGSEGTLLTFKLRLSNHPVTHTLVPTAILSNAQGKAVVAATQNGSATIQAPNLLVMTPTVDFGHIPIRATYTRTVQLKNDGNVPLLITSISSTNPLFVPQTTTLTIQPQTTQSITLSYAPVQKGAVEESLQILSNAANGEQMVVIKADPFSVNELHVGNTSGVADNIVTLNLSMKNMDPIVALQCAFKLPKELQYVDNSLLVDAGRNQQHQTISSLRNDTLFLMIYSMNNKPLLLNDGDVASFQLRLNGNAGTYYLRPIEVILSDSYAENVVSATVNGYVRIQAPKISSADALVFTNAYTTKTPTAKYEIRNTGNAPLTIDRVTFLSEGYSVVETLPITIANGKTSYITVAYNSSTEGVFKTTMNLYTNDPNSRLKTVAVSGQIFDPNILLLEGGLNNSGNYSITLSLNNNSNIVAAQYDVHWVSDMKLDQEHFFPTERMKYHVYSVTPLDEDSYRVLIYSMSNKPFTGNKGELNQLEFIPEGEVDYNNTTILIDNIILSDSKGVNKYSQSSLSHIALQGKWVKDTVRTCDSYSWREQTFTKSGTYYDTLQSFLGCDSIHALYLTILPKPFNEYNAINVCSSELPFMWYGQALTTSGNYTAVEQYEDTSCDSVYHYLTFNVFDETLPTMVTEPIINAEGLIDVTTANEEIQAHIDSKIYAPNPTIQWLMLNKGVWEPIPTQPIEDNITNISLKYVIATDCGKHESTPFNINLGFGSYTRNVQLGYNTICLPHGSSNYTGATFYEIAYLDGDIRKIFFDEVTTLKAGYPYVFYPTDNQVVIHYNNTTGDAMAKNGLHGTFTDITAASNFLYGKYMAYGHYFVLCGNGCSLRANRAYIELNEIPTKTKPVVAGRRRVSLDYMDSHTTTGIDNITDESIVAPMQEGIYDILGRKVDTPTVSGFYIINGQKVFVAL